MWSIKPQSVIVEPFRFKFRASVAGAPKLEIEGPYARHGARRLHILVHFSDAGDVIRIERLTVPRGIVQDQG